MLIHQPICGYLKGDSQLSRPKQFVAGCKHVYFWSGSKHWVPNGHLRNCNLGHFCFGLIIQPLRLRLLQNPFQNFLSPSLWLKMCFLSQASFSLTSFYGSFDTSSKYNLNSLEPVKSGQTILSASFNHIFHIQIGIGI